MQNYRPSAILPILFLFMTIHAGDQPTSSNTLAQSRLAKSRWDEISTCPELKDQIKALTKLPLLGLKQYFDDPKHSSNTLQQWINIIIHCKLWLDQEDISSMQPFALEMWKRAQKAESIKEWMNALWIAELANKLVAPNSSSSASTPVGTSVSSSSSDNGSVVSRSSRTSNASSRTPEIQPWSSNETIHQGEGTPLTPLDSNKGNPDLTLLRSTPTSPTHFSPQATSKPENPDSTPKKPRKNSAPAELPRTPVKEEEDKIGLLRRSVSFPLSRHEHLELALDESKLGLDDAENIFCIQKEEHRKLKREIREFKQAREELALGIEDLRQQAERLQDFKLHAAEEQIKQLELELQALQTSFESSQNAAQELIASLKGEKLQLEEEIRSQQQVMQDLQSQLRAAGLRLECSQNCVRELRSSLATCKKELEEAQVANKRLDTELQSQNHSQEQIRKLEQDLKNLDEANKTYQKRDARQASELKTCDDNNKTLTQQVSALQQSIIQLEAQVQSMSPEGLQELQAEIERINDEKAALGRSIDKALAEAESRSRAIDDAKVECETLTQENTDLKQNLMDATEALRVARESLEKAAEEKATLEGKIATSTQENTDLKQIVTDTKAELETAKSGLTTAKNDLKTSQDKLTEVEEARNTLTQTNTTLTQTVTTKDTELTEAKRELEEAKSAAAGIQTELDSANADKATLTAEVQALKKQVADLTPQQPVSQKPADESFLSNAVDRIGSVALTAWRGVSFVLIFPFQCGFKLAEWVIERFFN